MNNITRFLFSLCPLHGQLLKAETEINSLIVLPMRSQNKTASAHIVLTYADHLYVRQTLSDCTFM